MTRFEPLQAREILERTPQVLQATLADISDGWARSRQESTRWSPIDIVGHLTHGGECDPTPRMRNILEEGPGTPFAPFDREWHVQALKGKTLTALLEEFATLRARNLQTLQDLQLTPEELLLQGRHPALDPVGLEQLLAAWAVHDLNHISPIAGALAARDSDTVGPRNKLDDLRVLQEA